MHSVILILIAIELGFVVAEDNMTTIVEAHTLTIAQVVRNDFSPTARSLPIISQCSDEETRQLLGTYPTTCVNDFINNMVNVSALHTFEPTEFSRFGVVFCRPECGIPVVEYYRQCLGSLGQNLYNFFIQICAQNNKGSRCYTSAALSTIRAAYSSCITVDKSLCCSTTMAAVASVDCCTNLLNVGGLTNTTESIPSDCTVMIPRNCTGSTLTTGGTVVTPTSESTSSSGAVALTFDTILGVFAVLIAILYAVCPIFTVGIEQVMH